jgi:hypothetical protein
MKQTAVEWLEYQLKIYGTISDENTSPSLDTLFKMLEEAKAMEKEQIENAYGDGLNAHRTNFCNREEYYNKIYKTI